MSAQLSRAATRKKRGRVLYVGQCYYNAWYLSRGLRKLGWRADVLNWDPSPANDMFYHGQDYRFTYGTEYELRRQLWFYIRSLARYDVFHFSGAHSLNFGPTLRVWFAEQFSPGAEIRLLKRLGKKIVYSNNGCLDGVSQTSFASWGDKPVCDDCIWRNNPTVCSDERNLAWGSFRNSVADFQVQLGGNRIDYNDDPTVHEVPEFFCLDPDFWRPDLPIPDRFHLPTRSAETVKIYHAVGNFQARTDAEQRNIKSSHIYIPLIEQLKAEGHDVELLFFSDTPNQELRFGQAQADIFVDMLTYGFFGASAREAMMLGKPVICYLREEWLEQMRAQIPEYVDELPIVSATPETVHDILVDLVTSREKREEIGRRSREFAVKWHSAEAGGRRFDQIYRELLETG